jgi:hypothetical protein
VQKRSLDFGSAAVERMHRSLIPYDRVPVYAFFRRSSIRVSIWPLALSRWCE